MLRWYFVVAEDCDGEGVWELVRRGRRPHSSSSASVNCSAVPAPHEEVQCVRPTAWIGHRYDVPSSATSLPSLAVAGATAAGCVATAGIVNVTLLNKSNVGDCSSSSAGKRRVSLGSETIINAESTSVSVFQQPTTKLLCNKKNKSPLSKSKLENAMRRRTKSFVERRPTNKCSLANESVSPESHDSIAAARLKSASDDFLHSSSKLVKNGGENIFESSNAKGNTCAAATEANTKENGALRPAGEAHVKLGKSTSHVNSEGNKKHTSSKYAGKCSIKSTNGVNDLDSGSCPGDVQENKLATVVSVALSTNVPIESCSAMSSFSVSRYGSVMAQLHELDEPDNSGEAHLATGPCQEQQSTTGTIQEQQVSQNNGQEPRSIHDPALSYSICCPSQ